MDIRRGVELHQEEVTFFITFMNVFFIFVKFLNFFKRFFKFLFERFLQPSIMINNRHNVAYCYAVCGSRLTLL